MTEKQRTPRVPRAVANAEKKFNEAEDALREFKEQHHEFMEQLIAKIADRERARERLFAAISDHRVGAAGMKVSIARPRSFDGLFLHQYLPAEIRDEIVSVQYKVDAKKFDKAVKDGLIDEGLVAEAFEYGDEKVSITKQIKPISLG